MKTFNKEEAKKLMKIYIELKTNFTGEVVIEKVQEKFNEDSTDYKEVWEIDGQLQFMLKRMKHCKPRVFFRKL